MREIPKGEDPVPVIREVVLAPLFCETSLVLTSSSDSSFILNCRDKISRNKVNWTGYSAMRDIMSHNAEFHRVISRLVPRRPLSDVDQSRALSEKYYETHVLGERLEPVDFEILLRERPVIVSSADWGVDTNDPRPRPSVSTGFSRNSLHNPDGTVLYIHG